MNTPAAHLGWRIRVARHRRGWTRPMLARRISRFRIMEMTYTGAMFAIVAVEERNEVMNEDVLRYMQRVLEIEPS